MDSDGLSSPPKILRFFRKNLLVGSLTIIGLAFLSYGIYDYIQPQKSTIEFGSEETKGASTGSETQNTLLVDIQGAVSNPGVYELEDGSRIKDLIDVSGGLSPDVNFDYVARAVNQAQKLIDGQKIYIPFSDEDVQNLPSSGSVGSSGLVGINSASRSQLEDLPRIGPVTAEKIVSGRPYSSLEDLVAKKVVSQKVFDEISSQISLN